ncbi:MAG: amidohydrolase [Anaerolineae bacterium]|nr:amidohydrolase [Anaerolineae bacterium]
MARPNLVLYNGIVHTMDRARPTASALAIAGERILAAGGDGLKDELAPGGIAIDLHGKTALPGLIDAHLHFVWYSLGLKNVDLQGVPTLDEALRRIAAHAAETAPEVWIRGGRWNCNLWGGEFPTRYDLDRVVPDHPVLLPSKDGHSAWVNSKALELAGVDASTPDLEDGRIFRNERGEPTGILQENAISLVRRIVPDPSLEEMMAACRVGMGNAHRVGLTGVHNCEGGREFAALQALERRSELTLRVLQHIPEGSLDAAIDLGVRDGLGSDRLRLCGVKAFADGALGSRSAWMLEPYETDRDNCGVPTMTPEAARDLVRRANGAGLSVAVHAIGDAANRMVLDAFEQEGDRALRNRIEHVQLLHPDDLGRLAGLKAIASMQPIHATSDIEIADLHWGRRAATGYAWRSLLDAGTVLAFGSDAPVEDMSPLAGIYAAVTRRRPDGFPAREGWYPEQRIAACEAVYAYTMGAAFAGGEEAIKGSLAPGKLADLVVLDRDILSVDPELILSTQVLGTMVGGAWVYGRG